EGCRRQQVQPGLAVGRAARLVEEVAGQRDMKRLHRCSPRPRGTGSRRATRNIAGPGRARQGAAVQPPPSSPPRNNLIPSPQDIKTRTTLACRLVATLTSGTNPMLGRVFLGRYETIRLLGEGGMGRVYLARQLDLGRQVVVKVMHDHVATDPTFRERFL